MTTDERDCAQLYRDLCDLSMKKDAEGLRKLFAPGYVLVHMTGMRQPAQDYIAAVLDGTLNYFETAHDSIDVEIAPDGKVARIRGRSRVNAAVFSGGRHTWRLQQDLTAVKQDGRWLLASSRASTY